MKVLEKVLVIFIVCLLIVPHILNVGVYAVDAVNGISEGDSNSTNLKEVCFDVYFKEGEENKSSLENSIKNGGKLYVSVSLKDSGWISDGKLEFKNANFKIIDDEQNRSRYVKSIENNVVFLNDISYGQEVEIELQIAFEKNSKISEQYINRETEVDFSANYRIDDNDAKTVSGTKTIQNIWSEEYTVNTSIDITKAISLNNGFMIESTLNTEIQDDILPRKNEKIEIMVPSIDEVLPSSAYVILNGERLKDEFVEYNKESGKIIIKNEVENTNNEIVWGSSKNEYKIVYRYLDNIEFVGKTIFLKGVINTELLSGDVIKNGIDSVFVLEEKGKLMTASSNVTENVYKGYLYANSKYDTEYSENLNLEIANTEDIPSVEINFERSYFSNGVNDFSTNNVAVYKNTKINRDDLFKIIGDEGTLEIYDENNNLLQRVTKDSAQDANGDIVIEYSSLNSVRMVLTKPVAEGKLEIRNTKVVKGNTGFTEEQLKTFVQLKNRITVQGAISDVLENVVNLLDTEYNVNTQMSNTELSTIEQNKDIDIIGMLKTESNQYKLYENPSVQIVFPIEVTDVNVNAINLLYDEELKIVSAHKERNANGNVVLVLNLAGKQTDYQINSIAEGTNIVVNCDITLDEKAENKEETINYIVLQGQDVIQRDIKVTYKAPKEVTSVDKVTGYSAGEEIKTVMGKGATAKLDVDEGEKIVTFENSIMNFNEKPIQNVSILGKLPVSDNESSAEVQNSENGIETESVENTGSEEIGFTLEQLVQIKEQVNAQIYYTANENATKDLADSNNGWSENPEGAKMYLVVLPEGMQAKEILDINFQAKVPENLDYNKTSQYAYDVYYTLDGEEKSYSTEPITFTTGEGPDLDVSLTSSKKDEAYEEQILDFTVQVTNNGDEVAENINLTSTIPEGTNYIVLTQSNSFQDYEEKTDRQITWNIKSLNPGETFKQTYYVVAKQDTGIQNINFNAQAVVSGYEKVFESNSLDFEMREASLSIRKTSMYVEDAELINGTEIEYEILVKNITNQTLNNIDIEDVIPEGLEYKNSYYVQLVTDEETGESNLERVENTDYDENTKTVKWNIDTLEPNEETTVIVVAKVNSEESQQQYNNMAVAITEDGQRIESNITINNKVVPKISIEKSSSVENMYIKENQEFEYIIKVKNEGKTQAEVNVIDEIPDGILAKQLIYDIDGQGQQTTELNNNTVVSLRATIPAGGTLNMVIKVQADLLNDGEEEREVVYKAIVRGV